MGRASARAGYSTTGRWPSTGTSRSCSSVRHWSLRARRSTPCPPPECGRCGSPRRPGRTFTSTSATGIPRRSSSSRRTSTSTAWRTAPPINNDLRCQLAQEYYDYVDLDPFGTPVEFIPAALQALKRNGILAITATDTAPLAGTQAKKCVRRYGADAVPGTSSAMRPDCAS